jgi:Cullin family/Cullin protein neddylation domain
MQHSLEYIIFFRNSNGRIFFFDSQKKKKKEKKKKKKMTTSLVSMQQCDQVWPSIEKGLASMLMGQSDNLKIRAELSATIHSYCASEHLRQPPSPVIKDSAENENENENENERNNDSGSSSFAASSSSSSSSVQQSGGANRFKPKGASFGGGDLYVRLQHFLVGYLLRVRELLRSSSADETLLDFYCDEWRRYGAATRGINFVFSYLNQHWVRHMQQHQQQQQKRRRRRFDVYCVDDLCMLLWRTVVFADVKEALTRSICSRLNEDRNGARVVDVDVARDVISSFVTIGVRPARHRHSSDDDGEPSLELYKVLESAVVLAARDFYTYEAFNMVALAGRISSAGADDEQRVLAIVSFLDAVDSTLSAEEARIDLYFGSAETKAAVVGALDQTLLQAHVGVLRSAFVPLLGAAGVPQLARYLGVLLQLIERINASASGELARQFTAFVHGKADLALDVLAPNALANPAIDQLYGEALLCIYLRYAELIAAFANPAPFRQALHDVFRRLVNGNPLTRGGIDSALALASCIDDILRGAIDLSAVLANGADAKDALHWLIDGVAVQLESKQAFVDEYTRRCAERILQRCSQFPDHEHTILEKLKHHCGETATATLTRLFDDVYESAAFQEALLEKTASPKSTTKSKRRSAAAASSSLPTDRVHALDFNVLLLSPRTWLPEPVARARFNVSADDELFVLRAFEERLHALFLARHPGKRLEMLHHYARGHLATSYCDRQYTLSCTGLQIGVLLNFNGVAFNTVKQLRARTSLPADVLAATLESLVAAQVLVHDAPHPTYRLNRRFSCDRERVDVADLQPAFERNNSQTTRTKELSVSSQLSLQAAVIRVAKQHRRLAHRELCKHVVDQLASQFSPQTDDIHSAIAHCIRQRFISAIASSSAASSAAAAAASSSEDAQSLLLADEYEYLPE